MKKAIITGATGVLGTAIVKKLISQKVETYIVCRPSSPRNARIPDNPLVHRIECDLTDISSLDKKIDTRCDVFLHLAWLGTENPQNRFDMHLQNKNCGYALDAVDCAHRLGCECFIGAGSQAEYGRIDGVIHADSPEKPVSGYGMAKLCAGQMTRVQCNAYGMRHIWPRVLSVYGERSGADTLIGVVIKKLLAGEKPSLTKGEQIWDYLYASDAADAYYCMMEKGKANAVYVLGSGKTKKLKDFMEIIRNTIDPSLPLGIGEVPYYKDQAMHLVADITELTSDTGWVPQTSFEDGIRRVIDSFKDEL